MKIVFFGTSNISLPVLEALNQHHEVLAVVTMPDAPVGKKQVLAESPVSALAKELKINTFKPSDLKVGSAVISDLLALGADIFVVISYGKILSQEVLKIPSQGSLNVHPSLLPRYRGPTPIQTALFNGDKTTGTTIMLMDEEVDHGPLLSQKEIPIEEYDIFTTLADRLAKVSANLLIEVLPAFAEGKVKPVEQDHQNATYCKILTKQDGKVNWQRTAKQINDQFRAFYEWPGIWTTWKGQNLKILDCAVMSETTDQLPGSVIPGGAIACGGGTVLQIKSLQLAGKKQTDIESFLNGYRDFVGSTLL